MGHPKVMRLQLGRLGFGRNPNLWRDSGAGNMIIVRISASDDESVMRM